MINGVTHYVLGFMFTTNFRYVALIRKQKPDWQRGRLNGIGGRVEYDERPIDAMTREFAEETGVITANRDWRCFVDMVFPGLEVHCYVAKGDVDKLRSTTEETVEIWAVDQLLGCRNTEKMIENIPWLVLLAYDSVVPTGPHPYKARVQYL